MSALLAGVTKSRRVASTRLPMSDKPSTEDEADHAEAATVKHHGLHEDAAGAVVVGRFFYKARLGGAAGVVVSDAAGAPSSVMSLSFSGRNRLVLWAG